MNQRYLAPRGAHPDLSPQSLDLNSPIVPTFGGERRVKRRRVACNQCRQAKTRCEGADTDNKPCNRCAELSRNCIVDTKFRRVNKKVKLNELQQQVDQLRSQIWYRRDAQARAESDDATQSLSAVIRSTTQEGSPKVQSLRQSFSSGSLNNQLTRTTNDNDNGAFDTLNLSSLSDACSPTSRSGLLPSDSRSLESVILNTDQITELFQVFFECYHPAFPIFDAATSPNDFYTASPLLFWTVILISARNYHTDVSLMSALLFPVKDLLWSSISSPPLTTLSIKAICLLCMWPFPTSSMSTDISYTLAGIAVSSATHVGLHRPELLQDFSRTKCRLGPRELAEAATTWSASYIAAGSVTTSIGQASYFETEPTIEKACEVSNPYGLSPALYRLLSVQRFCNRVHLIMKDRHDDDLPMLFKLLEQDFVILTAEIRKVRPDSSMMGSRSSIYQNLLMLSAKLQLQTYHLFDDTDTLLRRQGVMNAYGTALKLILDVQTSDKEGFRIQHLPGSLVFICYLAAIVVMEVANSSYAHYVEVEVGKEAFNYIISMSRDCCVEDNDLMSRMSKILAQLWNVHRSLAIENGRAPGLKIKSRSLYSIVHDSLWLWREQFGGQSGNGASSLPSIIVPGMQSAINKDTEAVPSSASPPILEYVPSIAIDAENSRYSADSSSFMPNSNDVDFETSVFGITQEEQDWMWNVGLPSFNGMDFDLYLPHHNVDYNSLDHV